MDTFRRIVPLIVVLALGLSACGASELASEVRTISVTGSGSARLAPDIVLVNLGIQTQDSEVSRAVEDNNQRAERVMGALREFGIAEEDFQTTYFNVWLQQIYDEFGNPTEESNYWVDNTVSLKLRDPGRLGELLQVALNRGATSVNGVTFSVEDPSQALDQARLEAIGEAQQRAEQMATAAGATLGTVVSISDSGFPQGPVFEEAFGKGGGGGVPTSPGSLEFQVQVSLVYELR